MVNILKRFGWMSVALLLCYACSSVELDSESDQYRESEVSVRISLSGWDHLESRAVVEMLYPIDVLVVPEGSDQVLRKITISSETEFNISLSSGTYHLYAVCGLDEALMPSQLSSVVDVPADTDFAVGQVTVTVKDGVSTPSTVNISAMRQMSRLDVVLTSVPSNIKNVNLYVKGLSDTYSLATGWETSTAGQSRYTQLPLTKNAGEYMCEQLLPPCCTTGVSFVAEATSTSGHTVMFTYTSTASLASGTYLTQALEYGDLMLVDAGVDLEDWDCKTEEGTLSEGFAFTLGQQYFSQAATVVNISTDGKSLNILPHKPMTVTLDEVKAWDFKHVPYTLSPEISVQRWAFPTSETSMRNIVYAINQIGWDAFNAQFTSNGLTPIDKTATNILAYRDKTTGTFYVYDFINNEFQDVVDESGEFLVYPMGIIQLSE